MAGTSYEKDGPLSAYAPDPWPKETHYTPPNVQSKQISHHA